ncbi:undecaprenyl-diphosphate phosphatase [Candidatus Bipolaricaulota bacterium]|nr:undecaprenyl-diphosphate phosphatase [Candidatus Bipolaricaulota bacterium]
MIRAALLGIVQGLTEFLPVSSSGHLVLARRLLHVEAPATLLAVVLHLGTLVSILIVFRHEVWRLLRAAFRRDDPVGRRWLAKLIVASVPIAVVGWFAASAIRTAFDSTLLVGICLLLTAGLLFAAHTAAKRGTSRRQEPRVRDAVLIGLAQATAVLPGVSRSGATLSAALVCGLEEQEAVRFSFLLSIPAVLGAAASELLAIGEIGGVDQVSSLVIGGTAAAAVGWLAIHGVLIAVRRGRLGWFGVYCALLGVTTIVVSMTVGAS